MFIDKLVVWSAKKPFLTILIWLIFIAFSTFFIRQYLASALTTSQTISVTTDAKKAAQIVDDRLGKTDTTSELIIIKSPVFKLTDPAFKAFTLQLQKDFQGLGKDTVDSTLSFYQIPNPAFVSKNQDGTLVLVNLKGTMSQAQKHIDDIRSLVKKEDQNENFSVYESGVLGVNKDFQDLAEKDLTRAEMFGIPVALVVLILVFGAIGAAFIPMILSFLAIILALAATAIFGQLTNFSFFITNMITMMGLAVGIDYSLFIISRFREERAKGSSKEDAIKRMGQTASKAIFFSGITVIFALSGLLLIPSNIFYSLSIGAIFVVIAAVGAAITLLPAILSLIGDRVNWLSLPVVGRINTEADKKGFWHFIAGLVMSHPWLSLEISAGLLIWAAIPIVALKIGVAGVASLPDNLPSSAGFKILQNDFSAGLLSPTTIVVDADQNLTQVKNSYQTLDGKLKTSSNIAFSILQTYPDKNLGVLTVNLKDTGDAATETIKTIRSDYIPASFGDLKNQVYVGGQTASDLDFTDLVDSYAPKVFILVLCLSFTLLTLVFRSLVIPLKAIIMNLLSVGAAYGILVAVFEKGVGASLLHLQRSDQIETWIPLFLFAVLFGLSMDYHVFLLSRIKEHFNQTSDNTASVAFGLSTTGRLITGAALIMVIVFAAFSTGSLVMFQEVGFGLAVAIFLDATIVRSLLVPATMKLLGNWNWYLPFWLRWLPRIGIED